MSEEFEGVVRDYVRKFRVPERFFTKVLKNAPIEISFIDVGDYSVRLANREDVRFEREDVDSVKEKKDSVVVKRGNKRITLVPIFDNKGEVVEVIRYVEELGDESNLKKEIRDLKMKISSLERGQLNYFRESLSEELEKQLSEKERKILYAVACFPEKPEAEIAKMLGLKRSTFSSIKNRLKNAGYFRIVNVPNWNLLNVEVISFFYAELKKPFLFDGEDFKEFPELIFLASSQNYVFGLFVGERYGLLEKFLEEFQERYDGFLKGKILTENYLKETGRVIFKDFREFLRGRVRLKNSQGFHERVGKEVGKISATDKRLLFEFVKNPELSISELSKIIWASRPTLLNKRKKFLEEGLIVPLLILNLGKIGMQKFAVVKVRGEVNHAEVIEKLSLGIIEKKHSRTYFAAFKNSEDYARAISSLGVERDIESVVFDLSNMRVIRTFDISSFVEKQFFSD